MLYIYIYIHTYVCVCVCIYIYIYNNMSTFLRVILAQGPCLSASLRFEWTIPEGNPLARRSRASGEDPNGGFLNGCLPIRPL